MALSPGTRIGPYEVTAQIGAGGMGEVYRATDTNLARQVAIKVLPEAVAADSHRLARFEREARTLAALNHPNIAQIHELEKSSGVIALVMELVEGPTLADLIARGAIPTDEALPIARQIAGALEAAHEHGIIHRDLKPSNVKVPPSGAVKVLDFGLAKAMETSSVSSSSQSIAPTITTSALTQAHTILGTAAYMSPEQARGKPVDRRADIWAFGCVLYEMLSGRRAFSGDDVTVTVARVVEREPDWARLPADVSPTLVAYLKRCLHKDPTQRVGDIRDVRLAIEGAFDSDALRVTGKHPYAPAPSRPLWRRALLVTATAVVVALVTWTASRVSAPRESRPVVRMTHVVPRGRMLMASGPQAIDIAPGGEHFVYNGLGPAPGGSMYLRAMDTVTEQQVPSESVVVAPFFSPDGQSLGYFHTRARQLRRVGVNGGPETVITNLPDDGGLPSFAASWGADGTVLFGWSDGIWQVSENGGEPRRVLATAGGEQFYGPHRLPGSEWILFTVARTTGARRWDEADIVVALPSTGERRVVRSGGSDARYLPTGHLVYALDDTLYAVPFDIDSLQETGRPVPVLKGVRRAAINGIMTGPAFYAISRGGTLVYAPGTGASSTVSLVWTGLDGRQETLDLPPGSYNHPRLSHDGHWLAFERIEGERTDVWVYQLSGESAMRRLTEGGNNRYPVWSRDGAHVAFQSDRQGDAAIFWQRTDGAAPAERLTKPEKGAVHIPESWSRSEDRLAFSVRTASGVTLWMWTSAGRTAERFGSVQSDGLFNSALSPDGGWVAYTQRGRGAELYVASLRAPDTRFQVGQGSDAAHHPLWSADGKRLFYFAATSPMVVDVRVAPTVVVGRPAPLPNLPVNVSPQTELNHDIAADGSRFVIMSAVGAGSDGQSADQFLIVQNWFEELKRLVPAN